MIPFGQRKLLELAQKDLNLFLSEGDTQLITNAINSIKVILEADELQTQLILEIRDPTLTGKLLVG